MDYEWAKAAKKCVRSAIIPLFLLSHQVLANSPNINDANLVKEILDGEVALAENLSSHSELSLLEKRIENLISKSFAEASDELTRRQESAKVHLAKDYLSEMERMISDSETKWTKFDKLYSHIKDRPSRIDSQQSTLHRLLTTWRDQTSLLKLVIDKRMTAIGNTSPRESAVAISPYYAYLQDLEEGLHFSALQNWETLQKNCSNLKSSGQKTPFECEGSVETAPDKALAALTANLQSSRELMLTECSSADESSTDCEKLNLVLSVGRDQVTNLNLDQKVDLEKWLSRIRTKYSNRGGAK